MPLVFTPLVNVLPAPNSDGVMLHIILPNRTAFIVHVPRSSLPDEIMRNHQVSQNIAPQLPSSENNTNSEVINSTEIVPSSPISTRSVAPMPSLPAFQPTNTTQALPNNVLNAPQPQTSDERRMPMSFLLRIPFSTIRSALGQNNTLATSEETHSQENSDSDGYIFFHLDGLSASFEDSDFSEILNQLMQIHEPKGTPPASKDALESLKEISLTSKMVQEHKRCSVCCDDFEEGKRVVQLPCNHLFDKECVETWLKQHNTCPICRYELPVDDEEYEKKRKERMANRPQPTFQSNIQEAASEPATQSQETPQPMEVQQPEVSKGSEEPKKKAEIGLKKGFLLKKDSKSKPKKEKDEFLSGLKRGFLSNNKTNKRSRV